MRLAIRIRFVHFLLIASPATLSACSYPGAIYSSHQAYGLGIHTSAEGQAPVKVNLGYDQAVVAIVPRRGDGKTADESTSLISKNNLQTTINPVTIGMRTAAKAAGDAKDSVTPTPAVDAKAADTPTAAPSVKVLQVDAALITGTAAIVATLPADTTTEVVEPDGSSQTLTTTGTPGARIALALTDSAFSPVELEIFSIEKTVSELAEPRRSEVYSKATKKLPKRFQTTFDAEVARHHDMIKAFDAARVEYLHGAPSNDPRYKEIRRALKSAMEED